jgi:hypothetical protein
MVTKNGTVPALLFALFCLLPAVRTASAQSGLLNSPAAFPFTLNCGTQQITVVSPAGAAANSLVTSDNRVMLATSVTQVNSFIDPTTNQPTTQTFVFQFGAGHGQASGISDLTTCVSTPITFQDPQLGTVTATLTIVGFFVPR